MNNRLKGVCVAVSATVATALATGISVAGGLETATPLYPSSGPLGPLATFALVLATGLPVGMMFGALLGNLETPELPPRLRPIAYVVISLLFVGLCLPFWPDLAGPAIPIVALHALALARWTDVRVPLPRAVSL